MADLKSFQEVAQELADKYGIPLETVESLLRDWADLLYFSMTGRSPNEWRPGFLKGLDE